MKKSLLFALTMLLIILNIGNPVATAQTKANNEKVKTEEAVIEDLTYEEAIQRIAKYSGKSLKQVQEEEKALQKKSIVALTAACSYVEISQKLEVSGTYKPKFVAIVNKCRDGSFGYVTDIRYAGLDRYSGVSMQFAGDVKAWVANNQQGLEYLVNGDFYSNGTTTITFQSGVNTPVYSTTFGVSNASNHYRYFYSGYLYIKLIP